MHVVIQHRITDPDQFFAMDAGDINSHSPDGYELKQFFAAPDRSLATCLWQADSVDGVQAYVDPATAGKSENTYFEVDGERSMGIPEAAAASA